MAVTIRLRRGGRHNRPMYRVVAADSRSPREGRFLENLGWYRPLDKPAKVDLDVERTLHWLRQGARPSDTVASLFRQTGLAKIWGMAQRGEDYAGETLTDTIKERPHKVKSKARARMKEAAGVQESGGEAAPAAKTDAKPAAEAAS
ncbi:MAG TPA: 30S ribosomal protein S16 [Acidobacteriota bacterium]|nr:30S ribosomal protein S16 [Acidobacteriota bacterium]